MPWSIGDDTHQRFRICTIITHRIHVWYILSTFKWGKLKSYSLLVGGFNLIEKIVVKLDHLPKVRGENKKYLKPPPSFVYVP